MLEDLRKNAIDELSTGNVEQAYIIMCDVISNEHCILDDVYLAAEWALDSNQYNESIDLFTRALSISKSQNETWYLSTIYLARAYAQALVGAKSDALNDLMQLDDELQITWFKNHPFINKQFINTLLD
ncbi:MAG: hypothetical protein HOP21_07030 [Methylotenera sp.]|nr:hypothetical protein [Methylotenera sp.]